MSHLILKRNFSTSFKTNAGFSLPAIGLGTFGSDWQDAVKIGKSVSTAIDLGYRHFDCAPAYKTHEEVGKAIKNGIKKNNLTRDDIIIGSKLGNDGHSKNDVAKHCEQTLKELNIDYLDIYMIHWPWPNFHPPGCNSEFINPDSKPFIHEKYMETYFEFEKLYKRGLIKSCGVSNMTIPKMKLLLNECNIKPSVNQVELHPHLQQNNLVKYLQQNNITCVGYMPMGSPNRPDRDRFPEHTEDLKDPILIEISKKYGITVGQAALKFQLQRGVAVIPQTANVDRLKENIDAGNVEDFSNEDMEKLYGIDKNCRLIRGQVFSWKKKQDWHDLWDDIGDETWEGPINGTSAGDESLEKYL